MPRSQVAYVCQQCAGQYPQSYGRCPNCGAWGSLEETITSSASGRDSIQNGRNVKISIQSLSSVARIDEARIRIGVEEFDRVLGGGIVPGSAVLLGGDPGVGKSTLMLQVSALAANTGSKVLYATGEESAKQLKLRADRLGIASDGIDIAAESNVDSICVAATEPYNILVVDSIQTMRTGDLDAAAGSVSQVRECASRLVRLAKTTGIAVVLVGHVTKEGSLAGPKALEHIVDVVLHLEGDNFQAYRLLRGIKNRYGATDEIGVFDMQERGLQPVDNPSRLFLSDGSQTASGCAITATMEGTRPLLVEIQALTTKSPFGLPRRSGVGVDINRVHMLTAVLTKRAGVDIAGDDIYVNCVGGLRLVEPAVDLATVLAVYSSHRDIPLARGVVIGEVGLGGEIRPVQHLARRLQEAARLGINAAVIPRGGAIDTGTLDNMTIHRVANIREAIAAVSSSRQVAV